MQASAEEQRVLPKFVCCERWPLEQGLAVVAQMYAVDEPSIAWSRQQSGVELLKRGRPGETDLAPKDWVVESVP